MPSCTAYLDNLGPGAVEMQFTVQLHRRESGEIVWVSDEFRPGILKKGDSRFLLEFGERLRRSKLKVNVKVRSYKISLEIDPRRLDEGESLTDALRRAIEVFEESCKASDQKISVRPVRPVASYA
jgi:hypothetical protein